MKECSLKVCLSCGKCNGIWFNPKGWWTPAIDVSNIMTFDDLNHYKQCFSRDKGKNYGPTDDCALKFEHTVLDNRRNFKLKSFEDFVELYNFCQENNWQFVNMYGSSYFLNKNMEKDKTETFISFRKYLFSTEAYITGKFGKVVSNMEDMSFSKSFESIEENKSTWLSKFAKRRTGEIEKIDKVERHRIVFPVAGVTFEDRQEKIKNLSYIFNSGKRMEVEFEPEPDNAYDKNAIKVNVLNNGVREHIGYVPKTLNKDQDNESKIENFNAMIFDILDNIERAETSWVGEKNGNYGVRVVCYEKN